LPEENRWDLLADATDRALLWTARARDRAETLNRAEGYQSDLAMIAVELERLRNDARRHRKIETDRLQGML
jgi:hypothetical protein